MAAATGGGSPASRFRTPVPRALLPPPRRAPRLRPCPGGRLVITTFASDHHIRVAQRPVQPGDLAQPGAPAGSARPRPRRIHTRAAVAPAPAAPGSPPTAQPAGPASESRRRIWPLSAPFCGPNTAAALPTASEQRRGHVGQAADPAARGFTQFGQVGRRQIAIVLPAARQRVPRPVQEIMPSAGQRPGPPSVDAEPPSVMTISATLCPAHGRSPHPGRSCARPAGRARGAGGSDAHGWRGPAPPRPGRREARARAVHWLAARPGDPGAML